MGKLPLDIRCRIASRYPGDPLPAELPAELSRRRRTIVADHELLEDVVRARNEARVYEARRAAVVARFATAHGTERAEAVPAAWEAEAERRGIARGTAGFWRGRRGLARPRGAARR